MRKYSSLKHVGTILLIVGLSVVFPTALSIAFKFTAPDWRFAHYPLHALSEGFGVFVAFSVAAMLLSTRGPEIHHADRLWTASALIGMGLLDGFHAALHAGQNFVWLHSVATFMGGILFLGVWFPNLHYLVRNKLLLPGLAFLVSLSIGLVSAAFPEFVPQMVDDQGFTLLAVMLNVTGGAAFIAAAFRFAIVRSKNNLLFMHHCLLFGMAALLFQFSSLWDVTWWAWHLLRLTAYSFAFLYFIKQLIETQVDLENANTALRRSNADLEQFTYIASHDLKTPLRGINNLASWLETDMAETLNEVGRARLKNIRNRVVRLETMLADLLQYMRAGQHKIKKSKIDIRAFVTETFDLVNTHEGIRLEYSGQDIFIETADAPLSTILRNLMSNAVNHHDKPAGILTVTWQAHSNYLELAVADDGPGIPPEFHERIFTIFQTLQPRDAQEGSGMGLAIVKKLVESAGGWIVVESNPSERRGTTFRFTWPTTWRPAASNKPQPIGRARGKPAGLSQHLHNV